LGDVSFCCVLILYETEVVFMTNTGSETLTPQEVADLLKIAKNTVYELIKRGELNAYKVGKKVRVDLKDVEEYKNRTKSKVYSASTIVKEDYFQRLNLTADNLPSGNLVICGQDPLLDILSRYLENHPNGIRTLRSYVGSYNGLFALYNGFAHVATAHLWDGDSGEYNVPYVKRMLPGIPCVIIHLAYRTQGFYVAKGNPRNIKDWEDLKRKDITIINREKGSGTRVLLDEHLRLLGIYGSSLNGYNRECTSHLAVASAIYRGEADLGIGNEIAGLSVKGIDFIPVQAERYEMIIKKEDFNKAPFRAIMEIIKSPDYKSEIIGIGGYNINEIGKIVT